MGVIWVVVKIMVRFWVPIMIRHLIYFGYPQRDHNFDIHPYSYILDIQGPQHASPMLWFKVSFSIGLYILHICIYVHTYMHVCICPKWSFTWTLQTCISGSADLSTMSAPSGRAPRLSRQDAGWFQKSKTFKTRFLLFSRTPQTRDQGPSFL